MEYQMYSRGIGKKELFSKIEFDLKNLRMFVGTYACLEIMHLVNLRRYRTYNFCTIRKDWIPRF